VAHLLFITNFYLLHHQMSRLQTKRSHISLYYWKSVLPGLTTQAASCQNSLTTCSNYATSIF